MIGQWRHTLADRRLFAWGPHNLFFKRLGDAGMKLLAPTAQQRPMRGILDEGVFERQTTSARAAARKINPASTNWFNSSRNRSSGRCASAFIVS